MTRFARVPESVLEVLPCRLVGRYAWLAVHADYATGRVPARSWSELAALMRCSERSAMRIGADLARCGVVDGEPPTLTLCVGTSAVTNVGTSDITPSYQRGSDKPLSGAVTLWEDFVEGRRGQRRAFKQAPRKFAEAVRASGLSFDELREVCRLAGESYADWSGAVNYENALDRGLEALSRGDTVADQTTEDWLNGG